jgi:DnaJ family protein A protein 5
MLFDVVPYMYPGCYSGYNKEKSGFYSVYQHVFDNIVSCERKQSETIVELPTEFGDADTEWETIRNFYQVWESFSSALNFAWEDKYNVHEDAPNRRIRRLMEDDNKKARRAAKKVYNSDILQLVAFVKRRDPRVKARIQQQEQEKKEQEAKQKKEMVERKKEQQKAKEEWRQNALREMEEAEEEDRLAGRIRLADLEDDYDYGGGKKKKGKKKKKSKQFYQDDDEDEEVEEHNEIPQNDGEDAGEVSTKAEDQDAEDDVENGEPLEAEEATEDNLNISNDLPEMMDDDEYIGDDSESEEEEEEPDMWRCECCRKDFKSEGQMENHMKSKKHKEAFKKYQAKLKKKEEELMAEMMDEMVVE